MQKWKFRVFFGQPVLTNVTNFLLKLVDMLLFSAEKNEFPFFVFPYFPVLPPLPQHWTWSNWNQNWSRVSVAGPGGSLSPRFLQNHAVFRQFFREKPLFWANYGLRPPPWGQNSAVPPDQNPGSCVGMRIPLDQKSVTWSLVKRTCLTISKSKKKFSVPLGWSLF